jgi:choline dehydrogenase-like flavoprotein
VCIIGAGAAGISTALELKNQGLKVALIESGNYQANIDTQKLYEGISDGETLPDPYLMSSRLRFFGGTTNHWGGYTRPLEPIDFEKRGYSGSLGWPIGRADLDPYYKVATSLCEVASFVYENEALLDRYNILGQKNNTSSLVTRVFHNSPPTRFGSRYKKEILESKNIDLLLDANVTELLTKDSGSSVEKVKIKTLAGNSFDLTSKVFVLAAGGLENVRLLMLSNDYHQEGLGNHSGLLGRYYMDHIGYPDVGYLMLNSKAKNLPFYHKNAKLENVKNEIFPVLSLNPEIVRRDNLSSLSFYLRDREFENANERAAIERVFLLNKSLKGLGKSKEGVQGSSLAPKLVASKLLRLQVWHAAQTPNPDSRVTLIQDRDSLGLRKIKLSWRVKDEDFRGFERAIRAFAKIVGQEGVGRVKITYSGEQRWKGSEYGQHHLGTTRMASNSKDGVVDRDCKVFGVNNLYIGSGSVFPSIGFANPTLTIVALAARIGDQIKKSFS